MYMKKILMAAMMLLLTVGAQAQNEVGEWSLKPYVGVGSARLTNMPNIPIVGNISLKRDFLPGFVAGAEVEYQLHERVSLTTGLGYALQGGKWKDFSMAGASVKNTKLLLGYIQLPVMAQVYLVDGLSLKAGVQLGYLAHAKMKSKLDAPGYSEEINESLVDDAHRFDLSIPIGASFEFDNNLVLDVSYKIGVTKVEKEDEDLRGDMRNRVFTITVGYKFDL